MSLYLKLIYAKIDALEKAYQRNRRPGALEEKKVWERKARELQEKENQAKR
jgi:hypothetical protein